MADFVNYLRVSTDKQGITGLGMRLLPSLVLGGLAFAVYASRLMPRGEQTPHC